MIFISHSSKQAQAAIEIVREIESRGGRCWIAPRDITKAGVYGGQIIEGIKQCHTMLVLVTADSMSSPQVAREIERAVHYHLRLMVVLLEDVKLCGDMEFYLSAVQWFPATEGLDQNVFARILAALPQGPAKEGSASMPPADVALKGAATKAGQVVVELSSAGKLDDRRAVHHAYNKAMNLIAFKDAAVISWRLQPAAIWFVMQRAAFTTLHSHYLSRTLAKVTGVRWSKCQIVETAPGDKPFQAPVYLAGDDYDCPECVEPRSVVCFLRKIGGMEDEWDEAVLLIAPSTNALEKMEVYLTQKEDFLYAHGNFHQDGAPHPTKVAVNFKVGLYSLVMNLVFRPPVSEEDEREFLKHFQNSIKFYVNDEKLAVTDPAFYGGALNVEFVSDHPAILRLRSERASSHEELLAVFERQRDVIGLQAEDTVATARRIEESLVGRTRGSDELPDEAEDKISRTLEFLGEAQLPPTIYTLEVAYRAGLRDKVLPQLAATCESNPEESLRLVEEVEKYDQLLAIKFVVPDAVDALAKETEARVIRVRAKLWSKVGNKSKAHKEYQRLLACDGADEADFSHAAWCAPRDDGSDEFSAILDKGLNTYPDSTLLLHNYGRLLRVSGDYSAALEKLDHMAELVAASDTRLGPGALFDLVCCSWIVGGVERSSAYVDALISLDIGWLADAYDWSASKLDSATRAAVRTALLADLPANEVTACLRLRARLLNEEDRTAEASKVLRRLVIKCADATGLDFVDAAISARKLGDKNYAYQLLAKGERKCPDASAVPYRLGWMSLEDGQHEEARAAFLRTVEVLQRNNDSPSSSSLAGLARSQWLAADEAGAAETMKLLCKVAPATATDVVDELRKAGRDDLAKLARTTIAEFDFSPESKEGLQAKAEALAKLGRIMESVELRRQVLALPDATPLNYAELVYEARRVGDEELASSTYASGRERFPNADVIPMNAGWAYVITGQGNEALAEFELAIALRSEDSIYAYLPLGVAAAHWLLGDQNLAITAYERALSLDETIQNSDGLRLLEWAEEELHVLEAVRKAWVEHKKGSRSTDA